MSAKQILIVDDNPNLRKILAGLLERRGYATSVAATGKETIQLSIDAKPDLILLDLMLPDMSGMDVARALRKNHHTAQIPIVGCSAYFGPQWREKALSAGMVEYLEKPLAFSKIEAVIEQQILLASQSSLDSRKSLVRAGRLQFARQFKGIKFRISSSVAFLRTATLSLTTGQSRFVNKSRHVRAQHPNPHPRA